MAQERTAADLVETLRSEQRYRWTAGDRVGAEMYLQQYPAFQADQDSALELVYHEVMLREERGETPQLGDYLQRFPQLAGQLAPLFEVHRALESEQLFDGLAGKDTGE